jgi:hypothetical protein
MVVAIVGIGEQGIRAEVFIILINGALLFDTTVAGAALEQIAIPIVPKNTINDVGIASIISTNTMTVISYRQISKYG